MERRRDGMIYIVFLALQTLSSALNILEKSLSIIPISGAGLMAGSRIFHHKRGV